MLRADKIEEKYRALIRERAVKENSDVLCHLKWQKASNDLSLGEGLLKISTDKGLKDNLGYTKNMTFFDWVIVTSYYSIFHATNSILGMKKIKITKRVHHATLIAFSKHFIINDELADELFIIYENSHNLAKELLEIIEEEKSKRGTFQYHRLSRYNLEPAKRSLENAKKFLSAIRQILKNNDLI